eukprot:jgi/Chlat1/5376/Chrsp35S05291
MATAAAAAVLPSPAPATLPLARLTPSLPQLHRRSAGPSSLLTARPGSKGRPLLVVGASRRGFGPKTERRKPAKEEPLQSEDASQPSAIAQEEDEDFDNDSFDDMGEGPSGEVPQVVTDRMLKRMLLFSGVPLLIGLLTFPGLYYLQKVQHWDVAPSVAFVLSIVAFGTAALGISYGVISASWDPSREGTFIGWREARANLPVLLDTWKRQRR